VVLLWAAQIAVRHVAKGATLQKLLSRVNSLGQKAAPPWLNPPPVATDSPSLADPAGEAWDFAGVAVMLSLFALACVSLLGFLPREQLRWKPSPSGHVQVVVGTLIAPYEGGGGDGPGSAEGLMGACEGESPRSYRTGFSACQPTPSYPSPVSRAAESHSLVTPSYPSPLSQAAESNSLVHEEGDQVYSVQLAQYASMLRDSLTNASGSETSEDEDDGPILAHLTKASTRMSILDHVAKHKGPTPKARGTKSPISPLRHIESTYRFLSFPEPPNSPAYSSPAASPRSERSKARRRSKRPTADDDPELLALTSRSRSLRASFERTMDDLHGVSASTSE
jgi:hypothetical protein